MGVSGDIQSEAQHKIRTLGAIGFINNPIDKSELTQFLPEYRLYRPHAPAPVSHHLPAPANQELDDAVTLFEYLQEMANIAMGQASILLAQLLQVFIHQPISKVAFIARSELNMAISAIEGNTGYAAVCQGSVGCLVKPCCYLPTPTASKWPASS